MSRSNNALSSGLDWVTLAVYLALVFIGWLMIYSSSAEVSEGGAFFTLNGLVGKHLIWVIISLFVFLCMLFIDWKFWDTFSYVFYILGILSLIAVLIFGNEINGSKSWFSLFGFSFQPGETAKFFTTLAISSYLSSYKTDIGRLKSQFTAIGFFILIASPPSIG